MASRNRVSSRTSPSIVGSGRIAAGRAVSIVAGGGGGATVPAAPSAFARSGLANNIGDGPVVVSWTAPNNGGAAITSYTLTYYWVDTDTGAINATLHTRTSSATSYTIAEAASHSYPGYVSEGTQPRWSYGGFNYRIDVAATNSVGTGSIGSYFFGTGGGG